jgi:hypothetical protein
MDEVTAVLWSLLVLGIYFYLCHRIAKRGYATGLYYKRVFITAVIAPLLAAIWVYLFRTADRGSKYLDD